MSLNCGFLANDRIFLLILFVHRIFLPFPVIKALKSQHVIDAGRKGYRVDILC